ncbi:hypothetical protein [Methanosarcina acetivorans]|uniref:Uncharacterized protein n=1 Tax=Methanosarcina acetivorans (strain ATCC 35395 / DSM 2834 / JCM 12185 / C2A) TaxID=188937 RepID=Q8TIL6_METAC|nr:hypothetical protein [Methanosarcina acetivorans]AAM07479.1 predicted protein [Methanosarcina acetivorans C2A]
MDEYTDNISISKLNIMAFSCSIVDGEYLEIIIRDFNPNDCTNVRYSIFKIDDDYTNWYFTEDSRISQEDNIVKFKCNLKNSLKKGFYGLSQLKFYNPMTQPISYPMYTNVNDFDLVLFEIRVVDETPHTPQELSIKYNEIIKKRNEEFLSGFGCSSQEEGMKEYRGLVFVKDCLLKTQMKLDRYQIIPSGYLPYFDEINKILSSIKGINLNLEHLCDKTKKDQFLNAQPVFVADFPKVIAPSIEEATKLIGQEVKSLSDLLSIQRSSYGSIFGIIVIDLAEGKTLSTIPIPSYRGNLVGGMLSGEIPQQIRQRMNKIRNNSQYQLYLSLYTDILREERPDFQIFRCWNLLETIARSKNYIGQPLLDIHGNQIENRKGKPRFIRDDAEELVTELIRQTYISYNFSNLANILQDGSVSIWYRRRNCTAHRGGCFHSDPIYCDRTKQKFIDCKQDHDNGYVKLENIFLALKMVIINELR